MYKGYIYKLTSPSGKCYIGQTINLKSRFNRYKNKHCKNQKHLYNAICKYGFDKFKTSIIKTVDSDSKEGLQLVLNEWEIYYIELHQSFKPDKGYNISKGGSSRLGVKESQETIQKKRDAWTEEKRKEYSIRLSGSGNPCYGKKLGRSHAAKYIEQYDLDDNYIATFDSSRDASEKVVSLDCKKIDSRNIRAVANGKRNNAGGYKWRWKVIND